MRVVTLLVMILAFGALASTALVLARYASSNPATRKFRIGVYLVLAVGIGVRAIQEGRTDLGMGLFFVGLSAFFCLLAWVAWKGPPPE